MNDLKSNYSASQRVQTEENIGRVNLNYFPESKMKLAKKLTSRSMERKSPLFKSYSHKALIYSDYKGSPLLIKVKKGGFKPSKETQKKLTEAKTIFVRSLMAKLTHELVSLRRFDLKNGEMFDFSNLNRIIFLLDSILNRNNSKFFKFLVFSKDHNNMKLILKNLRKTFFFDKFDYQYPIYAQIMLQIYMMLAKNGISIFTIKKMLQKDYL